MGNSVSNDEINEGRRDLRRHEMQLDNQKEEIRQLQEYRRGQIKDESILLKTIKNFDDRIAVVEKKCLTTMQTTIIIH